MQTPNENCPPSDDIRSKNELVMNENYQNQGQQINPNTIGIIGDNAQLNPLAPTKDQTIINQNTQMKPAINIYVDQQNYEENNRLFSVDYKLEGLEGAIPFIANCQPIPTPLSLKNVTEDMDPAPLTEEEMTFNNMGLSEHTRLDDVIVNPEHIFEPYDRVILVQGKDPNEWNMKPNPLSYLVLTPKSDDPAISNRHLFTVTPHFEPEKCCDCGCRERFDYQVLYKYKNRTFASLYRKLKCNCCMSCCCCCYFCCHLCDKHEDVSTVRLTKYPRFDYLPISINLGLTAIPTSCCKKCCGEGCSCCCGTINEGIDYYSLKEAKYKYRLGFMATPRCKCGNCGCCNCGGGSGCNCCGGNCCPGATIVRSFDSYIMIIDLQLKAVTGYVFWKKGSVGKIPGSCDCCSVPEFFYPEDHFEIFFPVGCSGIDKFMIFNLLVEYIYRHPEKRIIFDLLTFNRLEELTIFDQPTQEEMAPFKP